MPAKPLSARAALLVITFLSAVFWALIVLLTVALWGLVAVATLSGPAQAQTQPPAQWEGYIEEALANSALGIGIYQTLSFYNQAVFDGPYQVTGTFACGTVGACGTSNDAPVEATVGNLALPSALTWFASGSMTSLVTGSPMPTFAMAPAPVGQAYTFNGWLRCSSGVLCFNGWMPVQVSNMNSAQCEYNMYVSGSIRFDGNQAPSPPGGLCSPTLPNNVLPASLTCPNPNFPVPCQPNYIGCGPDPPPPLCTAR
jgi:hypothetical protein